jgi:hypothetical protein
MAPNLPLLAQEMEMLIAQQVRLLLLGSKLGNHRKKAYFLPQDSLLRQGHFAPALSNIIDGIQRLSLQRIRTLSGKIQGEEDSSVNGLPPVPLLILAFLIALCLVELARMSIRPKLDEWRQRRERGEGSEGGHEGRGGRGEGKADKDTGGESSMKQSKKGGRGNKNTKGPGGGEASGSGGGGGNGMMMMIKPSAEEMAMENR